MSGKHSVNLYISAGGLNLLSNFQKNNGGEGGLTLRQFLDKNCWEK